jgi:hypothetical protein
MKLLVGERLSLLRHLSRSTPTQLWFFLFLLQRRLPKDNKNKIKSWGFLGMFLDDLAEILKVSVDNVKGAAILIGNYCLVQA